MAFEDLLRSLARRADAEIEALLAGARDQAATLRRESDQRLAERSATALRERTRAVGKDVERAVADAVRLERLGELSAQVRARDRVLAAAQAKLGPRALAADYRAILAERFARAADVMGEDPARVRCAPALAPSLRPLARDRHNLRVEPDAAIAAGFTIESDDGRVVVDEVLEHRLSADADALGQLALEALGRPA